MNDQTAVPLPKDGSRPSVGSPSEKGLEDLGAFLDAERDPLEATDLDEFTEGASPISLAKLASLAKDLLAADLEQAESKRSEGDDARTHTLVSRVLDDISLRAKRRPSGS